MQFGFAPNILWVPSLPSFERWEGRTTKEAAYSNNPMACRVGHFLHLIMLVRSWSIAPCCYMRYCTILHVAWFMFFASQFFQSCEILWTCCRSSPGLIHALAFRSGTTWREYEEQTRHIKRLQTSLGIRCIRHHPSHPTLRSVQRASSGSGYSGTSRRCGLARLRCMASAWPVHGQCMAK